MWKHGFFFRAGLVHIGVKVRVFETHGPTLVEKEEGCKMLSAVLTLHEQTTGPFADFAADMAKPEVDMLAHETSSWGRLKVTTG